MGITELYPPQVEAILKGLDGKNILVSIPTASGKTLISEIIAVHRFLKADDKKKNKIIYLTPLKALASEKYSEFSEHWSDLNIKVGKSTSDVDRNDTWVFKNDIIIMTNEKADSLLRMNPEFIKSIGIVISDEIHLMNDDYRGLTLEMLLTRLKREQKNLQIIGLSATVSNSNQLADWLNAELILSDWRPVNLRFAYYIPTTIIGLEKDPNDGEINTIRKKNLAHYNLNSQSNVKDNLTLFYSMTELTLDIMQEDGQSLVFVNSRKAAMDYAKKMSTHIGNALSLQDKKDLDNYSTRFLNLTTEVTELATKCAECIRNGVAFHHAGLIDTQQRLIEEAFKNKKIKSIVATPTLAAGVNVPARRVIIQSIFRYDSKISAMNKISIMEFHQMAGRAGRPRYDPYGEVILLNSNPETIDNFAHHYYFSPPEKIISKLTDKTNLESHVLGTIASHAANSIESIYDIIQNTFYYFQSLDSDTKYGIEAIEHIQIPKKKVKMTKANLQKLIAEKKKKGNRGRGSDPLSLPTDFVAASELDIEETEDVDNFETKTGKQNEIQTREEKELKQDTIKLIRYISKQLEEDRLVKFTDEFIEPTDFGTATFQMYVKPSVAKILMDCLTKAKVYNENNELEYHPATWLYAVSATGELGMQSLTKTVMNQIILNYESYENYLPRESIPHEIEEEFEDFARDIKAVMILDEWIREIPEREITEKYQIFSGDLTRMIATSSWLLRTLARYSEILKYKDIKKQLYDLEKRIKGGIKEELLPLVSLKGIGRRKARTLFRNGIKSPKEVLQADPNILKSLPGFGEKLVANIQNQMKEQMKNSPKSTKGKKKIIDDSEFDEDFAKETNDPVDLENSITERSIETEKKAKSDKKSGSLLDYL